MIWAAPITIVCFVFYVLPFWLLGWYEYIGWYENCWAWKLRSSAPEVIQRLWKNWAGHCVGNMIVMVERPEACKRFQVVLVHEQQHVIQCMKLGVFQPILYCANRLAIAWACKNLDPYKANIFEIDARVAAGQSIVDGILRKKNQD